MNSSSSDVMANSRVFATLLRHFGGQDSSFDEVLEADNAFPEPLALADCQGSQGMLMNSPSLGEALQQNIANNISNSMSSAFTPTPIDVRNFLPSSVERSVDVGPSKGCSSMSTTPASHLSCEGSEGWLTSGLITSSDSSKSLASASSAKSTVSARTVVTAASDGNLPQNQGWSQKRSLMPPQMAPSWAPAAKIDRNNLCFSRSSNLDNRIISPWSDASASLLGDLALSTHRATNMRVRQRSAKGKPKRPLSAYNIFFKEERSRILEELPQEILKQAPSGSPGKASNGKELTAKEALHRKVDFHNLAKLVGKRWRTLDQAEFQRYKAIANGDLQRYRNEMNAYKASLLIKEIELQKEDAGNTQDPLMQRLTASPLTIPL